MAKRKKDSEAEGAADGQEPLRKTRKQLQAAPTADGGAVEQQRSTRARTRQQQQQQQQQQQEGAREAEHEPDHAQQLEQVEQQPSHQEGAAVLDDFQHDAELADSIQALLQQQSLLNPVLLLQQNPDMSKATRRAAQALLQYTLSSSTAAKTAAAAAAQASSQQQQQQQQQEPSASASLLQQLHTGEGFDAEQVWLQLEMHLTPLEKRLRKLLRQLDAESSGRHTALQLLDPEYAANLDQLLQEGSGSEGGASEDDEDTAGSDEEQGVGGSSDAEGLSDEEHMEGEEEEEAGLEPAARQKQQRGRKQQKQVPVIEDRFLKLSDMEAFLQQAERDAAGSGSDDEQQENDEDESGDDEDGVLGRRQQRDDEAAAAGSDDEEQMLQQLLDSSAALVGRQAAGKQRSKAGGKGVDGIMYADFFGADQGDSDADMMEGGSDEGAADATAGSGSELSEGEEGEEEEEEEEWEEGDVDEQRRQRQRQRQRHAAGRGGVVWDDDGGMGGEGDGDDGDEDDTRQALSTHEKRLLRMQERVSELEAEAMGERPWQLRGEVGAAQRPLNSALEVDMDYDNLSRPPPAPTEEATNSLEDMIKRRIAEGRYDDVVRVLPPPPEVKRKQLELDDTKAQQGLGELYEAEYVQAATGFSAPDKQDALRTQAQALFKALCVKLDALSSFTYAPKPVVTELEVRSDVAALALEEVAPLAVSTAALATPSEVYKAAAPGGEARAEQELTKEQRKRRRAKKKAAHKSKEAAKAAAAAARAAASGQPGTLVGRKSLSQQLAAATSSGLIKKGVVGGAAGGGDKSHRSSAVFGKLAAVAAAGGDGGKGSGSKKAEGSKLKSSALKL